MSAAPPPTGTPIQEQQPNFSYFNPTTTNTNGAGIPCSALLRDANVCVQISEGCGCFNSVSFGDDLPFQLRSNFYSAMAFVTVTDPSFCQAANELVCDHFQVSQSCCCQTQIANYRRCFFDNVLVNELPLTTPCQDTCGTSSNSGNTDAKRGAVESTGVNFILGFSVAVFISLGIGYCLYKRMQDPKLGVFTIRSSAQTLVSRLTKKTTKNTKTAAPRKRKPTSKEIDRDISTRPSEELEESSVDVEAQVAGDARNNFPDDVSALTNDFSIRRQRDAGEEELTSFGDHHDVRKSLPPVAEDLTGRAIDSLQSPQGRKRKKKKSSSLRKEVRKAVSSRELLMVLTKDGTSRSEEAKKKHQAKLTRTQSENDIDPIYCTSGANEASTRSFDELRTEQATMSRMLVQLAQTEKNLEERLLSASEGGHQRRNGLSPEEDEITSRLLQLLSAKKYYRERSSKADNEMELFLEQGSFDRDADKLWSQLLLERKRLSERLKKSSRTISTSRTES